MIRVLLADDHRVVRDGLRVLLEAQPDMRVVGDAANGRQALGLALRLQPDVAVVDIAMPELNGIEATLQMHDACPDIKVLVLSMHASTQHVFRALQAGAIGYLLKDSAGSDVVAAVREAHAGRRYLSHKIAAAAIDDYIAERHRENPLDALSGRERQILQLIVEGKSNEEAGKTLFLSRKTVETYRSRMMRKLDIPDLPKLVKFAIRHGVTQLD